MASFDHRPRSGLAWVLVGAAAVPREVDVGGTRGGIEVNFKAGSSGRLGLSYCGGLVGRSGILYDERGIPSNNSPAKCQSANPAVKTNSAVGGSLH